MTNTEPVIQFPVIRGLQAKREYYVAMWKIRLLNQISIFDEDDVPPNLRAQRLLNEARIPEISNYILDNPDDYVFSALTVSINSEVSFEPLEGQDQLGMLTVPLAAKFIVNDGQHRRAAIKEALKQRPELAHETIAVVFFLDVGLERSQQMFADLNLHAIRPSRSLGILYNHRDERAKLARQVVLGSDFFRDLVEMEKSSLAIRSKKLFTLSAFYNACGELVSGLASGELDEDANLAREYWEELARHFPMWQQVKHDKMAASEVREGYIHSYGITLQALGKAGNALLHAHPTDWKEKLPALESIDWSKNNTSLWEGRAMHLGALQKKNTNIDLTANVIKKAIGLALDGEAAQLEKSFQESRKESAMTV